MKTTARLPDELPEPEIEHIEVEFRPRLLTVDEVAFRLDVKPSWVYAHANDLGVYRLGKYLRFDWERIIEKLDLDAVDERRS